MLNNKKKQQRSGDNSSAPVAVSINMPVLDHPNAGVDKSPDSSESSSPMKVKNDEAVLRLLKLH